MKQKIILKIIILVAFFIAILVISSVNNKVYAALPNGSLKITVNISKESYVSMWYFKDFEYKIKYTAGGAVLDNEFADINEVTITNRSRW